MKLNRTRGNHVVFARSNTSPRVYAAVSRNNSTSFLSKCRGFLMRGVISTGFIAAVRKAIVSLYLAHLQTVLTWLERNPFPTRRFFVMDTAAMSASNLHN
jgi:hypothetical protein